MNFRARMLLSTLLPASLFIAALGCSLWGVVHTRTNFDRYLAGPQQRVACLTEMYAQALQMEQAMRNALIDPANSTASKNFSAATTLYEQASHRFEQLPDGPADSATRSTLARLRQAGAKSQAAVIELAHTNSTAAMALLIQEETPAWRDLRAALLDAIKAASADAAAAHAGTQEEADRATWVALALTAVAILTATLVTWIALRQLRQALGGDPADAQEALRRIASGDLSGQVSGTEGLLAELARMQASLRGKVETLRESADSIRLSSTEIAAGNQDLSSRTEQTASSLQQTSASMEQLTGTVRHSAASADSATRLAGVARECAGRGGEVMGRVVATMNEINAASDKIADIVGVIEDVAFQTNILALNAAVEAARAGDQGRGFAVVAGEVRSLAHRASDSAREIKALIGSSIDKVEAGSRLVRDAGASMTEIDGSIRRLSDVIGEIARAAAEQNNEIGEVNGAVAHVDQMTQQNAALVEESAAAAASLRDQAGTLAAIVETFQLAQAR